jgi:hypothetical protein
MVTIHEFNAAATVYLADYASRALFSRRDTARRVAATEEVVAHSRAIMVEVDTLITPHPKGLAMARVLIGAWTHWQPFHLLEPVAIFTCDRQPQLQCGPVRLLRHRSYKEVS